MLNDSRDVSRCGIKVADQLPRANAYNRFNAWGRQRELPPFPAKSFRQLYRERHGSK